MDNRSIKSGASGISKIHKILSKSKMSRQSIINLAWMILVQCIFPMI